MALHLDIMPQETYLHISVTGTYELQPAKENILQLFAACSQHKRSRVLVDFRSVEGSASKMDRYDFVSAIAELHSQFVKLAGRSLRIALVGPDTLISSDAYGEKVAKELSLDLKSTTDIAEALDWIETAPS
jgi:hypothetical protein